MRHVEVKLLWLQQHVQTGKLVVGKVSGTANIADVLTKYHGVETLAKLCKPHGVVAAARAVPTAGPRGGANHKGENQPRVGPIGQRDRE